MKSLDQIEPHTAITSLPITISTPGSYYLTGNLTATADGTSITIAADNVTIDLNRFTLSGGNTGMRTGIEVPTPQKNLCVRNGTLTGWTTFAILAFNMTGGVYEDLRVTRNVTAISITAGASAMVRACVVTGNGVPGASPTIFLAANGSVIDCNVSSNSGTGIQTNGSCNIVNSTASGNSYNGIVAGTYNTVAQCTASGNTKNGILAAGYNTVAQCTASGNSIDGILASTGTAVTDCTASGNDTGIEAIGRNTVSHCSVFSNIRSGLSVGDYCQVTGCTAATNNTSSTDSQAGVVVNGTGNRIDSNHFANNNFAGLFVPSVGNTIIRNTFYGAQSIVDPGNISGPSLVMSSGGTISSTNPWANIYY